MPIRVQLSRKRGYRKPEGAVVVSRPTRWGNPLQLRAGLSREEIVARYRGDLEGGRLSISVEDVRRELRGKDLACWCPIGLACHVDVLLEIANR